MSILSSLTLFSAIAFIIYGVTCIVSPAMKLEFIRFGLAPYRVTTGILQCVGGFSLGFSWYFEIPIMASIASGGLSLLMLLGFSIRLKVKDTIIQSAPALLFFILNLYVSYSYFELAYII